MGLQPRGHRAFIARPLPFSTDVSPSQWLWAPLDGTKNPSPASVNMGTKFETITGVISYTYG